MKIKSGEKREVGKRKQKNPKGKIRAEKERGAAREGSLMSINSDIYARAHTRPEASVVSSFPAHSFIQFAFMILPRPFSFRFVSPPPPAVSAAFGGLLNGSRIRRSSSVCLGQFITLVFYITAIAPYHIISAISEYFSYDHYIIIPVPLYHTATLTAHTIRIRSS